MKELFKDFGDDNFSRKNDRRNCFENYGTMNYGEFESSKVEGVYRFLTLSLWLESPPRLLRVFMLLTYVKKQLLATGWTVWVSNLGEGAIFRTHAEEPQYPLSRQYYASRVLSRGNQPAG